MRTLLGFIAFILGTIVCGGSAIVAQMLGVEERPGSIYDKAPRWWARGMLFVTGVRVRVHGVEHLEDGSSHIFVANHVSWYDVLALVVALPRYSFVAKAELFKVPLLGRAARAVGTIPIQRDNRKAAFQSYEEAAERIHGGRSVVVYPEGTRGRSYALRPFKKGPFVLAVAAGVPIIPTVIHGTIEILPRTSLWVRSGTVDVHLLEPVPTAGLSYEQRDALARTVYARMADAMLQLHGVESPPYGGLTATTEAPIAANARADD